MIEIGMNGITKNFGFKQVLDGVDLEIMTGDRLALVGRNGAGKSTLFKIIAGEETPDRGTVAIRRGATVGMLEQIPSLPERREATAREVLCEPFRKVMALEAEMRRLEAEMAKASGLEADPDALERLMDQYAGAQAEFAALDGYAMEEQFGKIVSGFGLEDLLERPFQVLSGGQKTIIKLASTILRGPDILLLDEPTNHLDIKTLEWFEDFLAKYRGTVIMISHDRYFLDKAATKTAFLEGGSCDLYHGNYSRSLEEQERQLLLEFEQYKSQQKKIDAVKAAIKRYREWGAQGDNPKFFRKAKELEKRLEKMELLERPQLEKPKIPVRFAGDRTGREVVILEDLTLTAGSLTLLEKANLTVYEREKVCLMGDNGTGKTTLVRAILDGNAAGNAIRLNPSVVAGYIPQEIRFEQEKDSVLDSFRREHICSEGEARNILAKYFFLGESVFKRVSALSGGEKVLLKLAALLQKRINLLVLDEPTNHIDIETREILEEALLEYSGTLLFVSHDRYFINRIAGRVVEIRDRSLVSFYGNYDEYRARP